MTRLEQLIKELPPDLQQEVEDFAQFLHEKRMSRSRRKPTFNWEGGLKGLKDQYTSVELQHRASDWRTGKE